MNVRGLFLAGWSAPRGWYRALCTREVKAAFTLLEILVAFAVLSTGITLIAVEFRRHIFALQILESSLAARRIAEEEILREMVRRGDRMEFPAIPADPIFSPGVEVTPVIFDTGPAGDVEMDRLTAGVSWAVRAQPRRLNLSVGSHRPVEGQGQ